MNHPGMDPVRVPPDNPMSKDFSSSRAGRHSVPLKAVEITVMVPRGSVGDFDNHLGLWRKSSKRIHEQLPYLLPQGCISVLVLSPFIREQSLCAFPIQYDTFLQRCYFKGCHAEEPTLVRPPGQPLPQHVWSVPTLRSIPHRTGHTPPFFRSPPNSSQRQEPAAIWLAAFITVWFVAPHVHSVWTDTATACAASSAMAFTRPLGSGCAPRSGRARSRPDGRPSPWWPLASG